MPPCCDRLAPDATHRFCFPADPDPHLPAPLEMLRRRRGHRLGAEHLSARAGLAAPGRFRALRVRAWPAVVRLVLGPATGDGRGGRRSRAQSARAGSRVRAQGDAERGRPRPSAASGPRDRLRRAGDPRRRGRRRLPPGTIVTAWNAMSQVQAAEIRVGRASSGACNITPNSRLGEVAAVLRRYGQILVDDGFFASLDALETYAREVSALAPMRPAAISPGASTSGANSSSRKSGCARSRTGSRFRSGAEAACIRTMRPVCPCSAARATFTPGRPSLGFLGLGPFGRENPGFEGWKSLDFLGFSRVESSLFNGLRGIFAQQKFHAPFCRWARAVGTSVHDFGLRIGNDWSWGSLTRFLIFCKKLLSERFPSDRAHPKATGASPAPAPCPQRRAAHWR